MKTIITRLQRRSRATLGSTMALLVALPMGAAIGLTATSASAAVPPAPSSATTSDTSTPAKTKTKLGEAVPWTEERAAKAAEQGVAGDAFKAMVFSKTAGVPPRQHRRRDHGDQKLGTENNFTVDATEDATAFNAAEPRSVPGRHLPLHHR